MKCELVLTIAITLVLFSMIEIVRDLFGRELLMQ